MEGWVCDKRSRGYRGQKGRNNSRKWARSESRVLCTKRSKRKEGTARCLENEGYWICGKENGQEGGGTEKRRCKGKFVEHPSSQNDLGGCAVAV